jgi:hypothetical protein
MKLSIPRTALACMAAIALVFGAAERCAALILLTDLTKERPKELGISVRSVLRDTGDVRVQVDFKITGAMRNFRWADLTVSQGNRTLVNAPLLPRKPAQDSPEENR